MRPIGESQCFVTTQHQLASSTVLCVCVFVTDLMKHPLLTAHVLKIQWQGQYIQNIVLFVSKQYSDSATLAKQMTIILSKGTSRKKIHYSYKLCCFGCRRKALSTAAVHSWPCGVACLCREKLCSLSSLDMRVCGVKKELSMRTFVC